MIYFGNFIFLMSLKIKNILHFFFLWFYYLSTQFTPIKFQGKKQNSDDILWAKKKPKLYHFCPENIVVPKLWSIQQCHRPNKFFYQNRLRYVGGPALELSFTAFTLAQKNQINGINLSQLVCLLQMPIFWLG